MPIWLEQVSQDPNIVIKRFGAGWTWDEYDTVEAGLFALLAAATTGRLDIIIDARATISFPAGIMERAALTNQRAPARTGITVVVASMVVLEMLQILSAEIPGFGTGLYHTSTLEDAYRLIREDRRRPAGMNDPGRNN